MKRITVESDERGWVYSGDHGWRTHKVLFGRDGVVVTDDWITDFPIFWKLLRYFPTVLYAVAWPPIWGAIERIREVWRR